MTVLSRGRVRVLALLGLALLTLGACTAGGAAGDGGQAAAEQPIEDLAAVPLADGERLQVIATTSIVGDVVSQVGGDLIELRVLAAPGQDPHSYEPTARDVASIEGAHIIFVNGFDLEETLLQTLRTAGAGTPLIAVSDGVSALPADGGDDHGGADPHVWMNPLNVVTWTQNIAAALGALDPPHAAQYEENAAAYADDLRALDASIAAQVEHIPEDRRRIVTNHRSLAYFAERYGFEVVGTVYAGAAELAEPNARDLATLVQVMQEQGVSAIFVDTSVSADLAEVAAQEAGTGVRVYTLYTGSLGEPGSGADSYIGMMQANIATLVEALGS